MLPADLACRLLLAGGLGAAVGLRTNVLIAFGPALFAIGVMPLADALPIAAYLSSRRVVRKYWPAGLIITYYSCSLGSLP